MSEKRATYADMDEERFQLERRLKRVQWEIEELQLESGTAKRRRRSKIQTEILRLNKSQRLIRHELIDLTESMLRIQSRQSPSTHRQPPLPIAGPTRVIRTPTRSSTSSDVDLYSDDDSEIFQPTLAPVRTRSHPPVPTSVPPNPPSSVDPPIPIPPPFHPQTSDTPTVTRVRKVPSMVDPELLMTLEKFTGIRFNGQKYK